MIVIVYVLLGVLFLTTGIIMNTDIKTFYPEFYREQKRQLWTATLMLACPLFFRGLLDVLRNWNAYNQFWLKSDLNEAIYNTLFFLLTSYTIVLSQLYSLIFGKIREKKQTS